MTVQGLLYLAAFGLAVAGMYLLIYGSLRNAGNTGWLSGRRIWGMLLIVLGVATSLIPSVV